MVRSPCDLIARSIMIFTLSIFISGLALLFAGIKAPLLKSIRFFLVLLALGAGQIHLAFLALVVFIYAELDYNFVVRYPASLLFSAFTLYSSIFLVTLASDISYRIISELFQLLIYLYLFLQVFSILRSMEKIELFLKMSVFASLTVGVMGIILESLELTEEPAIFVERGGNEGSLFLLLMGIIPCIFLFLKKRSGMYIYIALILIYAQYVATSRANYTLGLISLLSIPILMIKSALIRIVLVAVSIFTFPLFVSFINEIWESQQNYSTLQRILLYEAGVELAEKHYWTGWGWGSTSSLVDANSLTDLSFPHFHSTFIQFWVELGLLGLVLIALWTFGLLLALVKGYLGKGPIEHRGYIALSSLVVYLSGFTEALIFGFDRAIQVIFIVAIVIRILTLKKSSVSRITL